MSLPHFFVESAIVGQSGEQLELNLAQDLLAHLYTLRVKTGEKIVLVDRPGHGWELEICASVDKRSAALSARLLREISCGRICELCLVQGISAADRMDMTVRQCTELGVTQIIPLMSERSTVRLNAASGAIKRERWQRVAKSAAEQSGQLFLPEITPPVQLDNALSAVANSDLVMFFWEETGGCSVAQAVKRLHAKEIGDTSPVKVTVFIGPEGGFSDVEAQIILQAGAVQVGMGETILRTETAAVVASALTLYHLGALGAQVQEALGAQGAQLER